MSEPKSLETIRAKLFKIQHRIKNPVKDTQGYGYKYATLEQVLELLKPFFLEFKLLLTQRPLNEGQMIGVETVIHDLENESGSYESKFFVEVPKRDPQGYGSAITYCRRYALVSMFNLAPEDDDGRASISEPIKTGPLVAKAPSNAPSLMAQIDSCLRKLQDKDFTNKVTAYLVTKKDDPLALAATLSRCQARLKDLKGDFKN